MLAHVGTRDADAAYAFMMDVASRLVNRVQLTTDGHAAYLNAVDAAFWRLAPTKGNREPSLGRYSEQPGGRKAYRCVQRADLISN